MMGARRSLVGQPRSEVWKRCPPAVAEHMRDVDLILRGGPLHGEVLGELAGRRSGRYWAIPTGRMCGLGAPGPRELGSRLAWRAHDSGRRPAGAAARRRSKSDLVILGHSHIRWT